MNIFGENKIIFHQNQPVVQFAPRFHYSGLISMKREVFIDKLPYYNSGAWVDLDKT